MAEEMGCLSQVYVLHRSFEDVNKTEQLRETISTCAHRNDTPQVQDIERIGLDGVSRSHVETHA